MVGKTSLTLVLGIFLSVFASAILVYISIATMIGPWIAPTIVLLSGIIFKIFFKQDSQTAKRLIVVSALASGGGITAVGIGFSLPMLYFLAPPVFANLMSSPFFFVSRITGMILLAGTFGIFLGKFFTRTMLNREDLTFPISQIAYQVASAPSHKNEGRRLLGGVSATFLLCTLRDGISFIGGIIPKEFYLFTTPFTGPLTFAVWPTLWAIGFTAGIYSTLPMLIGLLARHTILYPINHHSNFLSFSLFAPLKEESFITAFCAGLVASEIILFVLSKPCAVITFVKKYTKSFSLPSCTSLKKAFWHPLKFFWQSGSQSSSCLAILNKMEPVIGIASFFVFFSYLEFSLLTQLTVLTTMLIALYEINRLCGKIGLLQLGRFSIFILIPIVVLFDISPLQMTGLTIFFNVAAAVSSDLLSDYKTADLNGMNRSSVHVVQWIGLLVSSISIAVICYLLFNNLSLGSGELFAHRGRTKALLLQSLNFNAYVVGTGFFFGAMLKKLGISPTMALGGILMPGHITLGFVFGGLLAKLAGTNKRAYLSFCSGIFATETLWLLISLSIKILFRG